MMKAGQREEREVTEIRTFFIFFSAFFIYFFLFNFLI